MENTRVIFKMEGKVAILTPNPWAGMTLEEIIAKDIPSGTPYKIVDISEIPTDVKNRDNWDFDGEKITNV